MTTVFKDGTHWHAEHGKLGVLRSLWGEKPPAYQFFDVGPLTELPPDDLRLIKQLFFKGKHVKFGDIELHSRVGHNVLRIRGASYAHASVALQGYKCHLFQAGHAGSFAPMGLGNYSGFISFKRTQWPEDLNKIKLLRRLPAGTRPDLAVYDIGLSYRNNEDFRDKIWAHFYTSETAQPIRKFRVVRNPVTQTGFVLITEAPENVYPYFIMERGEASLVHLRVAGRDYFFEGYTL